MASVVAPPARAAAALLGASAATVPAGAARSAAAPRGPFAPATGRPVLAVRGVCGLRTMPFAGASRAAGVLAAAARPALPSSALLGRFSAAAGASSPAFPGRKWALAGSMDAHHMRGYHSRSLMMPPSTVVSVSPLGRAVGPSSAPPAPSLPLLTQSRNVNVFAKFMESVRRQVKERQDFQEGVKQLSATGEQIASSDVVQRAKAAAEATGGAVKKVVDTAEQVLESEAVKKTVEVTGKVVVTVAKPIVDNPVTRTAASGAQALHKAVENPDSTATNRYTPYKPRDVREAERAEREARAKAEMAANPFIRDPNREVEANDEANNVVLHQQSRWAQSWESFKEKNPVMQRMFAVRSAMEESDNPIVERFRDVFDTVGRAFGETETAQTVRRFKAVDPKFRTDKFIKDAHEWIIPDVMESYLRSDSEALKEWCGESTYSVLSAGIAAQKVQGLISDCKLLDVRNVELVAAKILDTEVPVLVVSFQTQEILLFRNAKGEVAVGKEDNIEHATYAAVFTRDQVLDPTLPISPRTKGWRVIDMAKHFSRAGL
ncbi:hypothetical protein DFJ74DRAFT_673109 [Hyaloraphidium curvatum]|nr:hypothetical protein DFJ74DRAFT_673109 [Hyaloraphidium curvatum]